MDGQMDQQTDGQMDELTDERMDKPMDGYILIDFNWPQLTAIDLYWPYLMKHGYKKPLIDPPWGG